MKQVATPPTIYLADTLALRFPATAGALQRAFAAAGATVGVLPGTRDVWARDYMPVPTSGGLVQFCYAPDYLRPDVKRTITDGGLVANALGLPFCRNPLLVDGGNVVSGFGRVLMTDKVFRENPALTRAEVRAELENALQADRLDFVPADPDDFTGHADGLVCFLDERTVLVNDYCRNPVQLKYWERLKAALQKAGLDAIPLPYNPFGNEDKDSAVGTYLNFVEVAGTIIVPLYGLAEDDKALKCLERLHPHKAIVGVDGREIAREGGVFHCITWASALLLSRPVTLPASGRIPSFGP